MQWSRRCSKSCTGTLQLRGTRFHPTGFTNPRAALTAVPALVSAVQVGRQLLSLLPIVFPLQLGKPSGPPSTGVQPGAQRGTAAGCEPPAQGGAREAGRRGPYAPEAGSSVRSAGGCSEVLAGLLSVRLLLFSWLLLLCPGPGPWTRGFPLGWVGRGAAQPSHPGGVHTLTR